MNIITIETNGFGENCYIVTSDQGNAAVIDPGGKAEEILSYLGKNGLTAKKILLTHGHFDHIAAVWELKQATGAEIAVHELDGGDADKSCQKPCRYVWGRLPPRCSRCAASGRGPGQCWMSWYFR